VVKIETVVVLFLLFKKEKQMKKISLLSLFVLLVSAYASMNASCDDACGTSCDGEQLRCGQWSSEFHGGLVPTVWSDRGCARGVSCLYTQFNDCAGPVVSLGKMPKFRDLFRVPWTVGGRIHYATSDCMTTYIEFNYIQAREKPYNFATYSAYTNDQQSLTLCHDKYKAYNAYWGVRRYMDVTFCDCLSNVSWFVGMKVGLIHHKEINTNVTSQGFLVDSDLCCDSNAVAQNACGGCNDGATTSYCKVLYQANTTISGGGELGFDYCLTKDIDFVLTVGFLGNGGLKPACSLHLDAPAQDSGITDLIIGCFATEIQFPIQFGFRFKF
jgi:hypothetical protein